MGDNNPLYLDDSYRKKTLYDCVVAPPAMMQMWTMRDFNDDYAPGSTDAAPYQVFDVMTEKGYPGNVAVSYDIRFYHLLVEGDRAHHYTTVVNISDRKTTALGEGFFVTERVEYLDQDDRLFAEASISYFQYRPIEQNKSEANEEGELASLPAVDSMVLPVSCQPDFQDINVSGLNVGDALPELVIPITHKLIVGGAIATQDFIPVHHNTAAAKSAAMPDIFMNILTTSGLSARYLSDWAGPASRLTSIKFKLMSPNTPGDTMIMQGQISDIQGRENETLVSVDFSGKNKLGLHVAGAATLSVP
jgi:acyl dehydratase